MGNNYKNNKGVYIETHTDKSGKDHINVYNNNPKNSHDSIHINWNSKTGKGSIVDTTNGSKSTTNTSCYLTTACMKHFQEKFDDNCYELTVLRWFRDNFVSSLDIEYYYKMAPLIVEAIEDAKEKDIIYDYIYENIVDYCVTQIENGNYDKAYSQYKNSILYFETSFVKPFLEKQIVKTLKK